MPKVLQAKTRSLQEWWGEIFGTCHACFNLKNTLLKNRHNISNMITATITFFSLSRANRLHKT